MGLKPDAIGLLAEVAAWYERRTTNTKMYDPNVGISGGDWRDALEGRPVGLDWFRKQFKTTDAGRKLILRANDQFIAADVRGEFGVTPFSINRPDRVFGHSRQSSIRVGSNSMVLFSHAVEEVSAVLGKPSVKRVIASLRLSTNESLHVYVNCVTVYLQPTSRPRILGGVASAIALADRLPARAATIVDVSGLPSELAALVPLARRWGLSDDVDRGERLRRTSTRGLRGLVRAVAPLCGAVNAYLDSCGDAPMPESATIIGALAECAVEAQLLLEQRAAVPAKRLQPATRGRRITPRRG
jgi:hypothetical protein